MLAARSKAAFASSARPSCSRAWASNKQFHIGGLDGYGAPVLFNGTGNITLLFVDHANRDHDEREGYKL